MTVPLHMTEPTLAVLTAWTLFCVCLVAFALYAGYQRRTELISFFEEVF